jgi:hypothetical protein
VIIRRRPALAGAVGLAALAALAAPGIVLAHGLSAVYESRLPLVVYLAGAGGTVALSFAFVLLRDLRAPETAAGREPFLPPAWLRVGLRAIGLLGWLWIVAQGIVGGSSFADVASLFLWVYGWVAVPIICAFAFPIWQWLDPFSTLYDLGAAAGRRVGLAGAAPAELPAILRGWPAAIGFAFFIWVELALEQGTGRLLFIVLLGYTAFTLAMMAQFGRDAWRANGETFSVWFRLVGRLAPFGLVDEAGRLRRRAFGSGLLEPGWSVAAIAIVALGVGSIILDGLLQTEPWFAVFGAPSTLGETVILAGFLSLLVAAAIGLVRVVGLTATGAGLLPIAVGYLVAHYLTYLLIDGQRIVNAIGDPLQQGRDLFDLGLAFFEPSGDWLPPGLVWTAQLAAVVGGHMIGAWAGHVAAARDHLRSVAGPTVAGPTVAGPAGAVGGADDAVATRRLRVRQVPLAVVMVILTTVTLWSLGQAIVREDSEESGRLYHGDSVSVSMSASAAVPSRMSSDPSSA